MHMYIFVTLERELFQISSLIIYTLNISYLVAPLL